MQLVSSAALALAGFAPSAHAVNLQVTGDDGNPVRLGSPVNVRNMNPQVSPVDVASGDVYSFSVAGPNGSQVAVSATCSRSSATPSPRTVDYIGNGTYTANLVEYAPSDTSCSKSPTKQTPLPFTVSGSTSLTGPTGAVLTRKPGSFSFIDYNVPIDLNPGALAHEVRLALNGTVGPDGGPVGTSDELFADSTSRTVGTRFKAPGRYLMLARAKGYSNSQGQFFTAWSAPLNIQALGPFDIKRLSFPDARGPSYRLAALFNERSVTGRVSIALAKGSKGRYRSLGSAKVSHHAVSKRFRASGPGAYRVRFKYKGNSTVASGYEVDRIRITRRISFRSATVGR